MKTYFVDHEIRFTGEQMRSFWLQDTFGITDDAIASFVGDAKFDLSPDFEEIKDGLSNFNHDHMLHFIVEHFMASFREIQLYQRLLAQAMIKVLGSGVVRDSMNLYYQKQQLSISSIAAGSVSSLIYMGIFISQTNGNTASLRQLLMDHTSFSIAVMQDYAKEVSLISSQQPAYC